MKILQTIGRKSNQTKDILALHSSGFSNDEIWSSLKDSYPLITYAAVCLRVNRNGLKGNLKGFGKRVTKLNEEYFDVIDTEQKAYFFGLICADGSVNSLLKRMRISLKVEDGYLIEQLRVALGSSAKISVYKPENGGFINSLAVYSSRLVSDLIKQGCIEKKSLTLPLPNVNYDLWWHFIRGYFDGDGCIGKIGPKRQYLRIAIIGSINFSNELQRMLVDEYNIKSQVYVAKGRKYAYLVISNQGEIIRFRNYMYENSTISMLRKKEIFYNLIPINKN